VRVNPDFELKGSGMKMGGGPKQFGVDAEQVPELLALIGKTGLDFEGFHLFAGSQNLKAESICEAQQKSYELALKLAAQAPSPVRFLNLGGGFGIPYFPGEQVLDLAPIGDNLRMLAKRAEQDFRRHHWSSSWAATWWAKLAFTSPGSSTARCRVARFFWWSMAD
jgi:diaminopimelate decarboxylase